MRLSGWQRLVVVLAVLWTIAVGVRTWQTWPHLRPPIVVPSDDGGTRVLPGTGEDNAGLAARRASAARYALGLGLGPPLAIWGLELASRWVRRGFKENGNKGR